MRETLLFGHTARQPVPQELRREFDVVKLFIGDTREPGTFRSDVGRLRQLVGRAWNPRLFDLLTVACTLRAADRYYRSGDVFAMTRNLRIACTVHEPERWRTLAPLLAHAVFRLSSDQLSFTPVPLQRNVPAAHAPEDQQGRKPDGYRPDSVCLFSGGADSFCGAAHLLAHRRRPLFVSLSVGAIAGRQRELFAAIRRRFPRLSESALIQLTPWPYRSAKTRRTPRGRWQHRDSLQRLRATFFLTLAALVSRGQDIDELFMCENGIIGAAIIFAPDQDNPTTTRPAEPSFLRAMEAFLRAAVDNPSLAIRNPFQYKTKGEVLRECAALDLADPLPRTVSCWRSGNQGIRNCGVCVPCLYRQLAFDESGLPRVGRYFRGVIPKGRRWHNWSSSERRRLVAVHHYAHRVAGRDIRHLLTNELAVYDAIDVTGGPTRKLAAASDREVLDAAAPRRMAKTVLRFARATRARLP